MAARIPLTAGGLDGALVALVGTVIATERHSDTRVRGGGSTTIVNGQGYGNTTITTDVTVTRDIWLRDAEGREQHKSLHLDLPVRVGQRFAFIGYEGAVRRRKGFVSYEMRICNLSTDKYYEVNPTKLIAAILSRGSGDDFPLGITVAWAFSVFLCLAKGIGLLGIVPLVMRHRKVRSVRMAENQVVQDIVEAKFRDMLALVDAEGTRLVPPAGASAGPQPQRGTAA